MSPSSSSHKVSWHERASVHTDNNPLRHVSVQWFICTDRLTDRVNYTTCYLKLKRVKQVVLPNIWKTLQCRISVLLLAGVSTATLGIPTEWSSWWGRPALSVWSNWFRWQGGSAKALNHQTAVMWDTDAYAFMSSRMLKVFYLWSPDGSDALQRDFSSPVWFWLWSFDAIMSLSLSCFLSASPLNLKNE